MRSKTTTTSLFFPKKRRYKMYYVNQLIKSTAILWLSILIFFQVVNASDSNNKEESLVFLNWSEYMDPDLIKMFEEKFNAKVKEVFFETDETKEEMLIDTNARGFDVILSSGISIPQYIKNGWLSKISLKQVPNRKHIDPRWQNATPQIAGYAIPYVWGTTGIVYRKDLLKKEVSSWLDLYRPDKKLRGKIVMINDSKDTVGMALKALGYSMNSETKSHYDEVRELLHAQKPYVFDYSYVALNQESSLVSGKIWMSMVYNGDGLVLQNLHPQISFSVPKEGTNLWVDYLLIMKHSKNKTMAARFINFLNKPENAAKLSEYLMFATPNKAALKLIPSEHRNNKMIYPDAKTLEKSEVKKKLSPKFEKRQHTIFAEVAN